MTASDTRAAAADTWEGDGTEEIAIKVGNEVKKYKVTDTNGTLQLDASTTPFYRSDKSGISVTAWYPYSDTEPTAPTIATDQRENQESSNLMKATATAVYGKATTLTFSHQTARIRLHLYKEGSNTDNLTEGMVKVKVTNADGSTQTTYTAHEDGKGYYSVLVASGSRISSGADFVSINDGNVGPYKSTAPANVTFLAGTSYTYDFNLRQAPYVTFSATSEQGFKMTLSGVDGSSTFEYSIGDGEWKTITSGMDYVTFGGSNGNLRLRGVSTVGTYTSTISFKDSSVPVAATGDIRTLVDYINYDKANTGSARFSSLFSGCTSLTSAPALPAMTLANYCYSSMFNGCTSLTSAPELPATTIAKYCYQYMFNGCTSLTSAPELDAMTLADGCYAEMFHNCTSLTSAPELPATTIAKYCYYNMFNGCTSLTTAPAELPATTLAYNCYADMFNGCTSLTSAPELPATTLATWCYNSMFYGCTSLTSAPELPATTLATWCYNSMFNGCTSLTSAPSELPATTLAKYCYYGMFSGCTSLTTAPTMSATTLAESCCHEMFSGCSSLTSAPTLLATTLAENCYYMMFTYCSSLTSVTIKAESALDGALSDWLCGVSYSGTIYKKAALTLEENSNSGIPSGWTTKEITE